MKFVLPMKYVLSFGRKVSPEVTDSTTKFWLSILDISEGDQLKEGNNSVIFFFFLLLLKNN